MKLSERALKGQLTGVDATRSHHFDVDMTSFRGRLPAGVNQNTVMRLKLEEKKACCENISLRDE